MTTTELREALEALLDNGLSDAATYEIEDIIERLEAGGE
jgi:hypothetical protein